MAAELASALAAASAHQGGGSPADAALVSALSDPVGYVSQLAATALLRGGGRAGIAAASRFWQSSGECDHPRAR